MLSKYQFRDLQSLVNKVSSIPSLYMAYYKTMVHRQELSMSNIIELCCENSSGTIPKAHSRENHKWLEDASTPLANSCCFDADTLID